MKDLKDLVRPNVWNMKPYSSARDEFQGNASVFLDNQMLRSVQVGEVDHFLFILQHDKTAVAQRFFRDFLSQAEHGVDSQAMLVTASESIVEPIMQAIREQLDRLPRKEITEKSLSHSRLIVLKDKQEVIDFTNLYAPEHLIIQTTDYADIAGQVENAGSVFMGSYTPESAGDYASGTNHTLPTN